MIAIWNVRFSNCLLPFFDNLSADLATASPVYKRDAIFIFSNRRQQFLSQHCAALRQRYFFLSYQQNHSSRALKIIYLNYHTYAILDLNILWINATILLTFKFSMFIYCNKSNYKKSQYWIHSSLILFLFLKNLLNSTHLHIYVYEQIICKRYFTTIPREDMSGIVESLHNKTLVYT